MKTLEQFKQENNVTKIQFNKSVKTGRMFATVGALAVIVASNFNSSKPAYVIHNAEKGVHVVCNSGVVAGIEL